MKKFLYRVVLIVASLGFSASAFAGDTLVASGGMYNNYVMVGCKWDFKTFATYGGSLKVHTLVCSGINVASYEYYYDALGAKIVTAANYYAVSRDGGTQEAVGGNYAIYKKAPTYNCKSGAIDNIVYKDSYIASMVRGNTANSNPTICGGPQDNCPLNLKAVSGGYQLWCGPVL